MASDPDPTSFLEDPLSTVCRKERRNLLAAGVIGVLVGQADLVPTKVTGFGIILGQPQQNWFVWVLMALIVYFATAFILYGIADYMIFRKKYYDYLEDVEQHMDGWCEEDQRRYDEIRSRIGDIHWVYRWSRPAAVARALFEFSLPVIIALAGLYSLALK